MGMREIIKSYQVFLPYAWERLLVYLVYPVLIVVFLGLLANGGDSPRVCMVLCAWLVVMTELYLDILVFGGIGAKDTNKLEYIKTSAKGMQVMKKSLVGDVVRRLFSVSLIMGLVSRIAVSVSYEEVLSAGNVLFSIAATLFLIELGLLAVRLLSSVAIIMAVNMTLSMLSMALVSVVVANDYSVMGVLCVLLAVSAMVGQRALIMRRARKSYYDGRS
jgi:hypothetical protein